MQTLARGELLPITLPDDSATADFFRTDGHTLYIKLCGMSNQEERALRTGLLKAGLLANGSAIRLIWQIYDENGLLLTLDSPFDARLIPTESRGLADIESQQTRMMIHLIIVDENNIIRGLRGITLSPGLSRNITSAVMDQLAALEGDHPQQAQWDMIPPEDLAKTIIMDPCGK